MVRRDYILRMIEECIRALARINSLKQGQRWDEAAGALDADPDNAGIVEFGIAFYQRMLTQSDAALAAANLPRTEVEEGLKELQTR